MIQVLPTEGYYRFNMVDYSLRKWHILPYFKHMCAAIKYPKQVTEMTNSTTMISTFTRLTTQLVILG
jgi:hypothetical protein